ncbi:MAG: endo-1,4-beta-xylanase [Bacteroidetes bacterium]|nr:endo-1,4-beta-xylanase [Bacteroidota bacterium]
METGRKQKDERMGITYWNVSGRNSWLDNFPVKGLKGYPLLFDRNL